MRSFLPSYLRSYFSWAVLLGLGLVIAAGLGSREPRLVAQEEEEVPPKVITVEPQKDFSITVSTNPSTGYTTGLAYVCEGVFLLRTETAKLAPNAPPGAPVNQTFHFYHWHPTQPEEAPEIVFGSFQKWDLQGTYREDKYVLDIKEAPKGRKAAPLRVPPRNPS